MEKLDNNTLIKTLSNGMSIFEILYDSTSPLGVNEIAKKAEMHPSKAFRILKTLQQGGWIFQCEDDRYIVGPRFSYLNARKDFFIALKEVSFFTMSRITAEVSNAMNLTVIKDNECIVLQQSRTAKLVNLIPPVNSVLPMHASAAGKILLAGLPQHLQNLYLENIKFEPFTMHTITNKEELIKTIEKIPHDGYAIDCYESTENAFCIAVPIINKNGETIASLSFSGIIGLFNKTVLDHYLPILRNGALEISQNLFQVYQVE